MALEDPGCDNGNYDSDSELFRCNPEIATPEGNFRFNLDPQIRSTYRLAIDAIRIGPGMLKVLLQTRFQRIGHLMKAYELANSHQLRVVPCGARVEPLDDRRNVTKDRGVHQSWLGEGECKWKSI